MRYERKHFNSIWHADRKQLHAGTYGGKWFLCYQDDASRFVTGHGVFDSANTENALMVLEQAIKDHGKPASIMADHGSQFYSNKKESAKCGKNGYEKRLEELGIYQILAGASHPQTNGKIERLHGEIQLKLHWYEKMMCRTSDPIDLFIHQHNYARPHMSLDREICETSAQAFQRKMPRPKETVIDGQTAEEYHAE